MPPSNLKPASNQSKKKTLNFQQYVQSNNQANASEIIVEMKSISDEQDLVSKNNNISNFLSQSIMTVSHPNLLQETEEHKSYRVKTD